MLQLRILALLGVLLLGLAQNPARAGEGGGITARSVFALLPASICENTPDGGRPCGILGNRRRD